jgi:hypothetical protein
LTFRPTRTSLPYPHRFFPAAQLNEALGNETISVEVCCPSSALERGSDQHRYFQLRLCCTHRFSQPPSAFFLPGPFRPCFMPVALLGFFPSESSPHWNPKRFSTLAPLLTFPPGLTPSLRGKPQIAEPPPFGCLQGFNPPASPFIRCRALTRTPQPLLSWFFSLQGSPTTRDGSAFTGPPLTHSHHWLTSPESLAPLDRCPRVSLNVPCGLSPKRLPSFLVFLPLSLFTPFWNSLRLGLSFHLGTQNTSPYPGLSSLGVVHSDRSRMSKTQWAR